VPAKRKRLGSLLGHYEPEKEHCRARRAVCRARLRALALGRDLGDALGEPRYFLQAAARSTA
jgi:hypothetical protein